LILGCTIKTHHHLIFHRTALLFLSTVQHFEISDILEGA